jgi:alpha-glucosidase (family GH31 glycosyl hydrolase)
VSTSSDG